MKLTGLVLRESNKELLYCDGLVIDEKTKKLDEGKSDMKIVAYLKGLPRVSPYTGSSAPTVELEGHGKVRLSYKFYTDEEVKIYNKYREDHGGTGGTGHTSEFRKNLDTYVRKLLENEAVMKLLDDDSKKFFETCKIEDATVAKTKKLISGMSPEQLALMAEMFANMNK